MSYAVERGIHVLVTKPAVQTLDHHNALITAAKKHNVVCFVEHHKRFVNLSQGSYKSNQFLSLPFENPRRPIDLIQCTAMLRPALRP